MHVNDVHWVPGTYAFRDPVVNLRRGSYYSDDWDLTWTFEDDEGNMVEDDRLIPVEWDETELSHDPNPQAETWSEIPANDTFDDPSTAWRTRAGEWRLIGHCGDVAPAAAQRATP